VSTPWASPRFLDCHVAFHNWEGSSLTRPHGSLFVAQPSRPMDTGQIGPSDWSRFKSRRGRHTHQTGCSHSPNALWLGPVSSQEAHFIGSSRKKKKPANRSGRFHCWLAAGQVTKNGQRVKASRSERCSSLAERLRQGGGFPQELRARRSRYGPPWRDMRTLSRACGMARAPSIHPNQLLRLTESI